MKLYVWAVIPADKSLPLNTIKKYLIEHAKLINLDEEAVKKYAKVNTEEGQFLAIVCTKIVAMKLAQAVHIIRLEEVR